MKISVLKSGYLNILASNWFKIIKCREHEIPIIPTVCGFYRFIDVFIKYTNQSLIIHVSHTAIYVLLIQSIGR